MTSITCAACATTSPMGCCPLPPLLLSPPGTIEWAREEQEVFDGQEMQQQQQQQVEQVEAKHAW